MGQLDKLWIRGREQTRQDPRRLAGQRGRGQAQGRGGSGCKKRGRQPARPGYLSRIVLAGGGQEFGKVQEKKGVVEIVFCGAHLAHFGKFVGVIGWRKVILPSA